MKVSKNIEKIITKGTMTKRMLLYLNSLLKSGLLTEKEQQVLSNSFKTDEEIRYFNKYNGIYNSITRFYPILLLQRAEYMGQIKLINSLSMASYYNLNFDIIINEILDKIDDKKKKKSIIEDVLKGGGNLLYKVNIKNDNENIHIHNGEAEDINDIDLQDITHGDIPNLATLLNFNKKTAIKTAIEYKTFLICFKDFIENENFHIQFYQDEIKKYEAELALYQGIFNQFNKDFVNECKDMEGNLSKEQIKFYDELDIYPDTENIKIDDNLYRHIQTKLYRDLKI